MECTIPFCVERETFMHSVNYKRSTPSLRAAVRINDSGAVLWTSAAVLCTSEAVLWTSEAVPWTSGVTPRRHEQKRDQTFRAWSLFFCNQLAAENVPKHKGREQHKQDNHADRNI